ncbi:Holliday junction ATP-dependent DNA helicase RuvA [compost metagenome]
MIDYLKGNIALRESDYVVLDVRGIGYRVFCPNPYALSTKEEEEQTLFIHYHVREDAHLLFGFGTRAEQSLFRLLLEVSGIGPKVALGILASGRPEAVIAAITQENVAFLMKLPGIGKKTAQRIILDLKDKLGALPISYAAGEALELGPIGQSNASEGGLAWSEAKEALMALGYTDAETDRAWQQVKGKVKESDAVDIIIKLALQSLYQM